MRWYYYYESNRKHVYNIPLWDMSTKHIRHWLKTFEHHTIKIDTLIKHIFSTVSSPLYLNYENFVDYCTHAYNLLFGDSGLEPPFPCNPQPRFTLRVLIYWRMRRWIKILQAELTHREDAQYRAFINGILHSNQSHVNALALADWCDDNNKPVMGRKLRRWVEQEQKRKELKQLRQRMKRWTRRTF